MPAEQQKRKLAAILSASAEGYSSLMAENEAATLQAFLGHRQAIGALVVKHRGRVVDSAGGSLLAEFASVVDALECAAEIQKDARGRNEGLAKERRMPFRIGIHLGEVIEEEGKIYGDGVQVAGLLDSLADAGGVCVSRSVHEQVKNRLGVGFQDLGEHGAENLSEPVRAYRVLLEPDPLGRTIGKLWSRLKRRQKVAVAIAVGLLQMGGGLLVKRYLERPPSPPSATGPTGKAALPLPDKPSIAVLPFDNMTGDPEQAYFADGFTEQIITSLSKVPALFVISRNSTFTYKGRPVKVQQVSEELGVRYVLEGSVQRMSSRIRINVQLIDATSGQHVWADSYDREPRDIFALQDELILKILTALQVKLTAGERARVWAQGTKSLEAYLKLMQAGEYIRQGNRESLALARRAGEETIALDPDYANAYALLGAAHMFEVYVGTSRPKESIAKAIELTQKALAMNGSLADAHTRLGLLYCWTGRHDEGIAEGERGVELDPNSGEANHFLGMILRYAGRPREAIPPYQKALRLEPMAPDLYVLSLALAHFLAGECAEAIATGEKSPRREPDNLNARVIMALIYGSCGREQDARKDVKEVLRINPKFTVASYTAILPYKNQSDRDFIAQGLRKAGLP
jgi:adenylate cyclase